uniref:Putative secreted protein n=1 Tax=Ixodes ricinus TaxID=34613 RepID=A0A6B0UD88_IXORI
MPRQVFLVLASFFLNQTPLTEYLFGSLLGSRNTISPCLFSIVSVTKIVTLTKRTGKKKKKSLTPVCTWQKTFLCRVITTLPKTLVPCFCSHNHAS